MADRFLQEKLKSLKSTKRKQKRGVDSNSEMVIELDPLTHKPTEAWERLKEFHMKKQLDPNTNLHSARPDNALRFVCLSDTHGVAEQPRREFHKRIPDGDVLIHCGDFTMGGDPSEVMTFNSFIGRMPHPVKLVIAGNHEMTFEDISYGVHPVLVRQQLGLPVNASSKQVVAGCKALLQNILYLEDESIDICGIKLYGSPWVPAFGSWGFSLTRGLNLLEKWNQIPSDTDILITHGPPCGYGDNVGGSNHAGCVELLNTVVKRVKPKFHVFGHIHSGYGMWTNGKTTFINSAVCSNRYKPDHDPIVFDLPLPKGYSREDFAQLSTESLRQAKNEAAQLHTGQVGGWSESHCSQEDWESVPTTDHTNHQLQKQSSETGSDVAAKSADVAENSVEDTHPAHKNSEVENGRSNYKVDVKEIRLKIAQLNRRNSLQ